MGLVCSKLCNSSETMKDSQVAELQDQSNAPLLMKAVQSDAQRKQQQQSTNGRQLDLSSQNTAPSMMSLAQADNTLSTKSPMTAQAKQEITYKDFERLQNLGSGAYGEVILVKKKTNNKQFAMKIIKKSKIAMRELNPQMIIEKNVLLENSHPFLIGLKYSFQTAKKLYLVMEYCPGGELYTYLISNKKFPLEISRFIAAEVLLGLEYLHVKMRIAYRDLKPENILVSEDGHLKIADFGLAKQFKSDGERTYSLRGTPEYIAPEIILAKKVPNHPGYGLKCDIWAIGVFVFELINGTPPFTDSKRNWMGIMAKILENKPVFTADFDDSAQDFIRKCLRSDPEQRIGWEEIKSHAFFSKISWNDLLKKELESPLKKMIPKRNGELLQRPRPIYETMTNEVFEQLSGYTYDPKSHINKSQDLQPPF